jgi:hypothetical protein
VGRFSGAMKDSRGRGMIGCACCQGIFYSTRNPGVTGESNGVHLSQGDCVEELDYFAEPLKLMFDVFHLIICLH